jgi:hypothetical protein
MIRRFTPDDEDSLRMMSNETLTHMRGQYLTKAKAQAEEPTEKPADDAGGKDKAENMKHNGLTKADLDAAVKAAVDAALKVNALSDEDKAALASPSLDGAEVLHKVTL